MCCSGVMMQGSGRLPRHPHSERRFANQGVLNGHGVNLQNLTVLVIWHWSWLSVHSSFSPMVRKRMWENRRYFKYVLCISTLFYPANKEVKTLSTVSSGLYISLCNFSSSFSSLKTWCQMHLCKSKWKVFAL